MSAQSLLRTASLFEISPSHVDEGFRIGFLHEDKAAALGRLMAVDGQRDPIKVIANPAFDKLRMSGDDNRPWRLVTGMHRLIGARFEAITVFAIEVTGKPEVLADLEASENLHRRPLGPIERAKFTAALVAAAQTRLAREHGDISHQKRGAKMRWAKVKAGEIRAADALTHDRDDACANIAQAYGWEESVGEALEMSRRSIHNALEIHRLIVEPFPALVEALARHPVVGENASQLRMIAAVQDEAKRRKVIETLIQMPHCSADEARVLAGIDKPDGRAATPFEKFTNQISGGLSRMTATEQKRGLPSIVSALKSDDVKRQLRDMLNFDLGGSTSDAR